MRRLVALAFVLAMLPAVSAQEAYVVLLDWQEGRTLVGTTSVAMSPLAPEYALPVDACHRTLLIDLLYDPDGARADQEGAGSVFLGYDWLVELLQDGAVVAESRIRNPGYGFPIATVDDAGAYTLRLSLANGVDVSWQLRVRAREVLGELACEPRVVVNEVELNPPGIDAGHEWVEIHNAGSQGADLSLWTLRAKHGTPAELVLPEGTWLEPGARLVVTFASGQALDNVDEQLDLLDAFGRLRDATPLLADGQNDTRTWQRVGDGGAAWQFAASTPGAPNTA